MRGRSRWGSVAASVVTATLSGCLVACAVASGGPDQAPTPGATVAAFYGDSYTRGTGASSPERRWSSIVAEERGWYEFNPSVDGLGYVINRGLSGVDLVDLIVDFEPSPDLVIVTMGLNDNFVMPDETDEIETAIGEDLERFRDELPDARLVVVEPFWHTDERPGSVERIIEWVEEAAERVGADHIDGASRWLEGHPEWMAADGIHPNDEGYAEIARRMDEELERLGL
ncbi:SGNH/GDSL hydrolase family protein [Agromyces sp. NPDC049794]|uniref:SGNH/GDSL hydrolase family protein n=1 Tax=unclassified Agromyces TaxID=2639701 RepID=UPI0033D27E7E